MNIKTLIFATLLALCAGSILLLIDKEYIIIRAPHFMSEHHIRNGNGATRSEKKEISFYFWHNNKWLAEKKLCIWLVNNERESGINFDNAQAFEQNKIKQANLKQLVIAWLATLQAELGISTADITVQATALNPSGYTAYISFSAYPLPANSSVHDKLMWIEGLLKTIRSAGFVLQSVHFLHNHQQLQDPHLDFSNPWPIHSFVNKS